MTKLSTTTGWARGVCVLHLPLADLINQPAAREATQKRVETITDINGRHAGIAGQSAFRPAVTQWTDTIEVRWNSRNRYTGGTPVTMGLRRVDTRWLGFLTLVTKEREVTLTFWWIVLYAGLFELIPLIPPPPSPLLSSLLYLSYPV